MVESFHYMAKLGRYLSYIISVLITSRDGSGRFSHCREIRMEEFKGNLHQVAKVEDKYTAIPENTFSYEFLSCADIRFFGETFDGHHSISILISVGNDVAVFG